MLTNVLIHFSLYSLACYEVHQKKTQTWLLHWIMYLQLFPRGFTCILRRNKAQSKNTKLTYFINRKTSAIKRELLTSGRGSQRCAVPSHLGEFLPMLSTSGWSEPGTTWGLSPKQHLETKTQERFRKTLKEKMEHTCVQHLEGFLQLVTSIPVLSGCKPVMAMQEITPSPTHSQNLKYM